MMDDPAIINTLNLPSKMIKMEISVMEGAQIQWMVPRVGKKYIIIGVNPIFLDDLVDELIPSIY